LDYRSKRCRQNYPLEDIEPNYGTGSGLCEASWPRCKSAGGRHGLHPELTGRENIYLNGAILGMRKAEINSKFDEIVEFAGVEKFLDTPVKRTASGCMCG